MDSEVIRVENLKETGPLTIKEGRNLVQRLVLEQYSFSNIEKVAWLEENGKRISDIIDQDELIKTEVREAMKYEDEERDKKLEYAASLIKAKLDEQDAAGYEK